MPGVQRPGESDCRCAATGPTRGSERTSASSARGLVGVVIPGIVGNRNLDDPYFDEFFRTANELGVAVGVHWITGCMNSPGQELFKDPYFYIHMVGMPFNLMVGLMTLIGGGIMEKYPRIKFVFLEIGAGWLPYWMWRMDDHYSRAMHHPTGATFHLNFIQTVTVTVFRGFLERF